MINRIIRIQNLGRFVNYHAHGDVAMRKLTLIYGENGRGKTTLCALLRSLKTGNTTPLQARQTIGQTNQPGGEILANGKNHRLHDGVWSSTLPEIAIFDSEFVHQNIYSGDHIARNHRRNSYYVIIGISGVELAQRIEQLDEEIRTCNASIRQLRELVQRQIEGNLPIEDFLQILPVEDVDNQIRIAEGEVENIIQRNLQAEQIQSRARLQAITSPTLPTGISEILASTVQDVSADAEARVREHIQVHLDANGEGWLEAGTRYATYDNCPFCGQSLTNSDLIALYHSYFNDAYRHLKRDVSTLPNLVATTLRNTMIGDMARTMTTNAELMAFWGQFIDLTITSVPTEQLQEAQTNAANALEAAITAKQQAPLDSVLVPSQWQVFQDQMELAHTAIAEYNNRVHEINNIIDTLKLPQGLTEIYNARKNLQYLQNASRRHESGTSVDCDALINEMNRKTELEGQKANARAELDRYCTSVLQTHQEEINHYLTQFNVNFKIANTGHDYVGGTPSSHFQIEINHEVIDLGDERTPENVPCFRTALSAGDRSALALAFFIATLRRDPNLANKIVIFDDPFSSQDRFRRAATQYIITKLVEDCDQVIVLSHDAQFLRLIEQNTQAGGYSRLQTSAVGEAVEISPCDLTEITGCPLAADRACLTAYVSSGEGTPINVARSIRPMLEGHLRQSAPGGFNEREMLGEMINAIRAAAPGDIIHRFLPFVDLLDEINYYARAFHHPPGSNPPVPQIDRGELKGYAIRALYFVGGA